jgi:hypothetical protein
MPKRRSPPPTRRERDAVQPIPAALPSNVPLFEVPGRLLRFLDRDQVFAGLARVEPRSGNEVVVKPDDRGRTIDIHALRHTFWTHPSKAGVRRGPLRPPCGTATRA